MSGIDFNPIGMATKAKPNQFSDMSSEDFLKVIFTELTNQDPLQPSDSGALLQQMSTIRSIESDLKLMQHLEALVQGNQFAAAGNLIGKFIGGMTQDLFSVAGWVVAIVKQGDSIYLELDTGWLVPLANVQTVIDPSLLPDNPKDGGSGDPIPPAGEDPVPGDESETDPGEGEGEEGEEPKPNFG